MMRRIDKAPLLDADGTMPPNTLMMTGQSWKLRRRDGTPIPLTAKLFWLRRRINNRWISQRYSLERV
jgi:hypothetical protein